MARITVVGAGYVGLVTGVAFRQAGHDVVWADVNAAVVDDLKRGRAPLYEPGLEEALQHLAKEGRLEATTETATAAGRSDFVFLCVGTPSRPDGSMDETALVEATRDIARGLAEGDHDATVVVKSTVVPGTTEGVIRPILREMAGSKDVGVGVNPEFLREGTALRDAQRPDRVVIGSDGPATAMRLRELYRDVSCPVVETDLRTAEMIKYATNAFLATKVAFANELANLCQALGVAYDDVIEAVTLDPRINPRFLVPGVGFGGSCLPKDLRALVAAGKAKGYPPDLFESVLAQNEQQHLQAIRLLEEELGGLRGKRIALLGLAFKGGTDDVRESRAIPIAEILMAAGATVLGYDPVANASFARVVPNIALVESVQDALRDADACLLLAEWPEFSQLDGHDFLVSMQNPLVLDGRRILDPDRMVDVRFRRIG